MINSGSPDHVGRMCLGESEMKRDMDFARHILAEIEAYPRYDESFKTISLDGHRQDELSYHVMLLHEAHLLRAIDLSTCEGPPEWRPLELTNEGHEFLEAARNDTVWAKAKNAVLTNTISDSSFPA